MKIYNRYNSLSCKALRPDDLSKFSKQQQVIINDIEERLNFVYSGHSNFDGKTPLKYYEDKGYDFFVRQGKRHESVELDLINIKDNPMESKCIKINRDDVIGDYDENSAFLVKNDLCDREDRLNSQADTIIHGGLILLVMSVATAIFMILSSTQCRTSQTKNVKQNMEQFGKGIADTIKTISKDTIVPWHK